MKIITDVTHAYFNTFSKIKTISTNSATTNAKIAVVVLTCFTVIIPLTFAIAFGIEKLVGRIHQYQQAKLAKLKTEFDSLKLMADDEDSQNIEAMLAVAKLYQTGTGVAQNDLQSFIYYKKAAREGSKEGQDHVKKLADQGDAEAQYQLGNLYDPTMTAGYKKEKNDQKCFEYQQKAADQGHRLALCNLGLMYLNGQSVAKNIEQGLKHLKEAAEKGSTSAQSVIGKRYFTGNGLEKNEKKGMNYLVQAARNNNKRAMQSLMELAHEQSNSEAQYQLGFLHYHHATKGINDAVVDYQKSPNQKYPENLKKSEMIYVDKALIYYHLAAEQKHPKALYSLGMIYLNGKGVKKDEVQGLDYLRQAAETGSPAALNALGQKYFEGRGVVQDQLQGIEYLKKADEAGNQAANKYLDSHQFEIEDLEKQAKLK